MVRRHLENRSSILETDKWYHLAMTYDGTKPTNAEKLNLYIDGIAETLTFTGLIPSSTSTNSASFIIGKYVTSCFREFLNRRIACLERTRTKEEVQSTIKTAFVTVPAELMAYYRFDHTSGNECI